MTLTGFNKALCFCDIHLDLRGGRKLDQESNHQNQDADQHNQDCIEFVDWAIEQFHTHRCEAILFLGDWFHNETRVQWNAMWASNIILGKLSQLGVPVYVMVGNHDMWYRHTRDIHSLGHLQWIPNIHLINEVTQIDDLLLCPYLLGTEFNRVACSEASYIFGHFALPGFLTNQAFRYESKDGLQTDFFEGPKQVYSGHFHWRQRRFNQNGTEVIFIGNCFPHNFNDLGDRNRGCMIFERDQEPIFINWDKAPTFDRTNMSEFLSLIESDQLMSQFGSKATIHIQNDLRLVDPDLYDIRKIIGEQGFRRIRIEELPEETPEEIALDTPPPNTNIQDYFLQSLNQVDTKGSRYRIDLLQDIFQRGMEKIKNG